MKARTGRARERGARKSQLTPGVTEKLASVHAHLKKGEGAEAAAILAELASAARQRDDHDAAARFSLRAHIAAGGAPALEGADKVAATEVLLAGWARHLEAGDEVASEVAQAFGRDALPEVTPINRAARRRLPKKCLECGAPAKAENVLWSDGLPVCGFCGSEL